MKRLGVMIAGLALVVGLIGCSSTGKKLKDLRLGMTPDEVKDVLGKPTVVRAAKVYEDGQSQQVWEYLQRWAINPMDFWIYYENDKLVQWGQPGDFSGKSGNAVPVEDYKSVKQTR